MKLYLDELEQTFEGTPFEIVDQLCQLTAEQVGEEIGVRQYIEGICARLKQQGISIPTQAEGLSERCERFVEGLIRHRLARIVD